MVNNKGNFIMQPKNMNFNLKIGNFKPLNSKQF